MIVFDLDGTLVDTRQAVQFAYLEAGITMPEDAWGKTWTEWCSREIHERKNLHYPYALSRYGRPLPLLTMALALNAPVITGASLIAVETVKLQFCPTLNVRAFRLSRIEKAMWLVEHWRQDDNIYVDDDAETRHVIQEITRWTVLSPEEATARLT